MPRTILTSAALALALAGCHAKNDAAAVPEGSDTAAPAEAMASDMPTAAPATPEFVAMAASGGMYEVESSKLAQAQAKNADVKAFAAMMIKDHTKANAELKAAAGKASPAVTVPATLNPEHQALLDTLKKAGPNFDKTYVDQQRTAHQKTLDLLKSYAGGGDSAPVKEWATKSTPVVQGHYDKAQALKL